MVGCLVLLYFSVDEFGDGAIWRVLAVPFGILTPSSGPTLELMLPAEEKLFCYFVCDCCHHITDSQKKITNEVAFLSTNSLAGVGSVATLQVRSLMKDVQ